VQEPRRGGPTEGSAPAPAALSHSECEEEEDEAWRVSESKKKGAGEAQDDCDKMAVIRPGLSAK